jgi:hypothetical protein
LIIQPFSMKKHLCVAILLSSVLCSYAQNTGIGITTPRAPLHVYAGASGNMTPFQPMVVEGSSSTYINILAPATNESGIIFGNATDAASGGIIYNNLNITTGTPNGFQFRTNGNTTRMVVTSAGNVGIAIPTPVERLEVGGAVKAQAFKYTTPKQTYYSIPGVAFRSSGIGDTLILSTGNGTATLYSGVQFSSKSLIVPVQLPDKAIMQDLTVYFADNSSSLNYNIVLYRKTITSVFFPDNIGSTSTSGSSTTLVPYVMPIVTFGASNVVDNTLYTYYIVINSVGEFQWAFNSVVGAAIIRYTMTEPIP